MLQSLEWQTKKRIKVKRRYIRGLRQARGEVSAAEGLGGIRIQGGRDKWQEGEGRWKRTFWGPDRKLAKKSKKCAVQAAACEKKMGRG
jgi:hypothetical protein